ncbi:unnamed protein product, partial [Polarella glacialis]
AWREVQEARQDGPLALELLHALLAAYCSVGKAKHAEEILAMSSSQLGLEPDLEAYALVLGALESADPECFRELWSKMLGSTSISPSAQMLESALRVAVASSDARFARSVLELMFAARSAPAPEMAQQLLTLPASGSESADLRRLLAAFRRGSNFGRTTS